ncbi:MAG: PD40 domain-containing protein [Myxococcales bacterium]|nr:PD40 domain-containing protein [Myxococcales bacterium]
MALRWPAPLLFLVLVAAKPVLSGVPDVVSWSADSQHVVLGGRRSGTLVLDRSGKGGLLSEKLITNAMPSPDGRWVVAARDNDFVAIDVEAGSAEPVPVPGGRGRPVLYLRTENGDVMVVKNTAHHEIHRFGGPIGDPASESLRNYVRLWADPSDPLLYLDTGFGLEVRHQWTGQLLRSLDAQRKEQAIVDTVRTEDGALVVALRDEDGFRIWTPPDPPGPTWDIDPSAPIALSGDGSFVAVGVSDGVDLRASASQQVVEHLKTKGPVARVAVSPDGHAVATVTDIGLTKVFEVAPTGLPPVVDRPPEPTDPGRIASEVVRRPLADLHPFDQTVAMPGATAFLGWAPSGRLVGWVGQQWVELDPETSKTSDPRVPKLVPGSPYAWADDGTVVAGVTETGVALVDTRKWKLLKELPTGGRHQQLQWHGKLLVVDAGSGRAVAWDPVAAAPQGEPFSTSPDPVSRFVQSPNGELLAVRGKVPQVIQAATGRPVKALGAQAGGVAAIAWSPDGKRLATTGNDGTLLVWDTLTWQPQVLVEGAHGLQVAFSPDGKRLASVSYDGAVIVDVEAGTIVERLPFDGMLASVDWAAPGLALADNAGNVYVRRP